jgi:hypothetical protein
MVTKMTPLLAAVLLFSFYHIINGLQWRNVLLRGVILVTIARAWCDFVELR